MAVLLGGLVVYSGLLVAAPRFTLKVTGVFALFCLGLYQVLLWMGA